ncbi:hypothetical protein C445_16679, partial [Halobiforma lacisalsi AJ5]
MGTSDDEQPIEEDAAGVDPAVWEETADDLLEESPYDTDLGKEMSRDAVRVSAGRMSE